jgi:hypothetical protein
VSDVSGGGAAAVRQSAAGPHAELARRLAAGEINIGGAMPLAALPPCTDAVRDDAYTLAVSSDAQARGARGDWRDAVRLQRLLLLSLATVGADAGSAAFRQALLHWIDIVGRALWHVPDPRLYDEARHAGEQLQAWGRAHGAPRRLGPTT